VKPPTSTVVLPRACIGPALRVATFVDRPGDWTELERWAAQAGVGVVADALFAMGCGVTLPLDAPTPLEWWTKTLARAVPRPR
jgi:hypothetical protein